MLHSFHRLQTKRCFIVIKRRFVVYIESMEDLLLKNIPICEKQSLQFYRVSNRSGRILYKNKLKKFNTLNFLIDIRTNNRIIGFYKL